jgi:hypothetical protein
VYTVRSSTSASFWPDSSEQEYKKIARLSAALDAPVPRFRGTSVGYPIRVRPGCRFDVFLGPVTRNNPMPHSIDGKFLLENASDIMKTSKIIEEIFSPICGTVFASYDTWYDTTSDKDPGMSFYEPATHVIPWDSKRRVRSNVLEYTSMDARRIISDHDGFDWQRAQALGIIESVDRGGWMKLHDFTGDRDAELARRKAIVGYCRHLTDEVPDLSPLPIRLKDPGAS